VPAAGSELTVLAPGMAPRAVPPTGIPVIIGNRLAEQRNCYPLSVFTALTFAQSRGNMLAVSLVAGGTGPIGGSVDDEHWDRACLQDVMADAPEQERANLTAAA
jgi:hypothetical protein